MKKSFPNVLQILPLFQEGGGVERGTWDIAQAILTKGHPAFVASAGGNLATALAEKGGVHISLPLESKNPLTILKNIGRLQQAVQAHGIDMLHVRSRAPAWSALAVSKTLNIPLITTYHAPYNAQFFLKKKYNAVMAAGNPVIAISHFMANHIQHQYGKEKWFDPQKLVVIPRGIDTQFFDPARVRPEELEEIRQKHQLPHGARILLLPGRLTRWKGQHMLIEVLAALDQRDIYVVFVGNEQGREAYVAELQKKAYACGVKDRVRFVPNTSYIPPFYALSTLVISASTDPEGFGRTIAEAGAMERPIIATNHGAAPEIVREGETGWLVPPLKVDALRNAIQKALALPEAHLRHIGEAARHHITTHFSQEVFCQKTLDIYETVSRKKK